MSDTPTDRQIIQELSLTIATKNEYIKVLEATLVYWRTEAHDAAGKLHQQRGRNASLQRQLDHIKAANNGKRDNA